MNYSDIKSLALAYADRSDDVELSAHVDSFLRIAEARISEQLMIRDMTVRTELRTRANQEYYGLPEDFAGLRDIEIVTGTARNTCHYLVPELMNTQYNEGTSGYFYTIIADQLHVYPNASGNTLEIVYYRKVPALTEAEPENWVSMRYPHIYVFALLIEISAYAKDLTSGTIWSERFKEELAILDHQDHKIRWSGNPLEIRRA